MERLAEKITQFVRKNEKKYCEISEKIWQYAELAFHEEKSAKALTDLLEQEGFRVTAGLAGIPTAFVAEYGLGKPKIGILGEYDALPSLSQKAGYNRREPLTPGGAGHGCGHNLLGVGAAAAAIAVKDYMRETRLPGTIAFYGCPAEENGSAKVYLSRDGVFEGLDGVFTWHPGSNNSIMGEHSLAAVSVVYRFHGRATHAAGQPHLGRSALDACELMNVGVNYLREHMIQEARIHYAYRDAGGGAPNVVQDHAALYYFIRSPKISQALELRERVDNCARGAALMTGTTAEILPVDGMCDYLPNRVLSGVLQQSFEATGAPEFNEIDRQIARSFQQDYPPAEVQSKVKAYGAKFGEEYVPMFSGKPLQDVVFPLRFPSTPLFGSTDVGDVSYVAPTAWLNAACYAIGTSGHSWQLAAQGGTSVGQKGMLAAARAIAHGAVTVLENPALLKEAGEEHQKTTGGVYVCAVPDDVKPHIEGDF
ncbi:MAG: amidohydrolase [Oscillospiraceae bacterium]|nr:amidohydrolase [Oscillospiraceae bacterium]